MSGDDLLKNMPNPTAVHIKALSQYLQTVYADVALTDEEAAIRKAVVDKLEKHLHEHCETLRGRTIAYLDVNEWVMRVWHGSKLWERIAWVGRALQITKCLHFNFNGSHWWRYHYAYIYAELSPSDNPQQVNMMSVLSALLNGSVLDILLMLSIILQVWHCKSVVPWKQAMLWKTATLISGL